MEKSKKTKKQKVQTHGQGLGRGLAGHGSELFVFFWFFHGFLQFGQNLEKTKKKKFRPMGKVWGEAWLGTWVWTFVFFWFFPLFFAVWPKPRENQKKNKKKQKVQTHGQGLGRGLAGDMGLNCFFVFFGFSMVFCSLAKTSRKPKKTKSSDPWARSGERPGRGHGSDFFPFFFACFSCGDAFITVPLKKCAFLQFAHLHPPWVPLLFKKLWLQILHRQFCPIKLWPSCFGMPWTLFWQH